MTSDEAYALDTIMRLLRNLDTASRATVLGRLHNNDEFCGLCGADDPLCRCGHE